MDVDDFEGVAEIFLVVVCPYPAQNSIQALQFRSHEGLDVVLVWQAGWSPMRASLTLPLPECTNPPPLSIRIPPTPI